MRTKFHLILFLIIAVHANACGDCFNNTINLNLPFYYPMILILSWALMKDMVNKGGMLKHIVNLVIGVFLIVGSEGVIPIVLLPFYIWALISLVGTIIKWKTENKKTLISGICFFLLTLTISVWYTFSEYRFIEETRKFSSGYFAVDHYKNLPRDFTAIALKQFDSINIEAYKDNLLFIRLYDYLWIKGVELDDKKILEIFESSSKNEMAATLGLYILSKIGDKQSARLRNKYSSLINYEKINWKTTNARDSLFNLLLINQLVGHGACGEYRDRLGAKNWKALTQDNYEFSEYSVDIYFGVQFKVSLEHLGKCFNKK
jgi:hypothetical protein